MGTSYSEGSNQHGLSGILDIQLLKLSQDISPSSVLLLGTCLGVPVPQIERYQLRNRLTGEISAQGTYQMLVDWRAGVLKQDQQPLLAKAFEEADLQHLIKNITETEGNSSTGDSGPLCRSSVVPDKVLAKLASRICGSGWQLFGIEHLDMNSVDIDRHQSDGDITYRIFLMLSRWKIRKASEATVGCILDLMEASEHIAQESYQFLLDDLGKSSNCTVTDAASTAPSSAQSSKPCIAVSAWHLDKLAKCYPSGSYIRLCCTLGFDYNLASNILKMHHNDCEQAVRDVFSRWQTKCEDGGSYTKLKNALRKAETAGLIKVLEEPEPV